MKYLRFFCIATLWMEGHCTAPSVVVSIKPIHSLVCRLMKGIGKPVLLMEGKDSPHHHALKPDEMNKLHSANIIIWVGPAYESMLKKPIDTVQKPTKVLTLLSLLAKRSETPIREPRPCGLRDISHSQKHHSHSGDCHAHESLSQDGHIWLDPNYSKAISEEITTALTQHDPEHAANYLANYQEIVKALDTLDAYIQEQLCDLRHTPYINLHDGTQYFDLRYGTKAVGSLLEEPGHSSRPRHAAAILKTLKEKKVQACFSEPGISTAWTNIIGDNTDIALGVLDYIGEDLEANEEAYFIMMQQFVMQMKATLQSSFSGRR